MGTTTFRSNIGAGPVDLRAKAGLSRRELHWIEGSKPQVLLSAMARGAALLSDRKVNESLILRLKNYARNQDLFRQAE